MKWEYHILTFAVGTFASPRIDVERFQAALNHLGEEHWELVSTVGKNRPDGRLDELVLLFKRPVSAA